MLIVCFWLVLSLFGVFFAPVHLACFECLIYSRMKIATTEEILLLLKDMDQEDKGLQGVEWILRFL